MKHVYLKSVILCSSLLFLSACGGGGSSSPATTTTEAPTATNITVSGTALYVDIDAKVTGLDYANPTDKPIRGAVVEVQNASGAKLGSTNTTETGTFSVSIPNTETINILVKASLGDSKTAPNTVVIDNKRDDAVWVLSATGITTSGTDVSKTLTAASGRGSSTEVGVKAYTETRIAGPFAILDVIYEGQKRVKTVISDAEFPALKVHFSPTDTEEGSSFDGDDILHIVAIDGVDTDEYDSLVVGHEWGHYLEDKFSRSDSTGGNHTRSDVLHPSLAFGEGYGYAVAAMILNDPLVVDTTGEGNTDGSGEVNIELDNVLDTEFNAAAQAVGVNVLSDGYYSEVSIQEVLWDLYDSGALDTDNDGLELGFAPIFKALNEGQKNTKAYTSIFSFLHYLKVQVPDDTAKIDALASAENIDASSNNEFEDPNGSVLPTLYTNVPADGNPVTLDTDGETLKTFEVFGTVASSDSKFGNKLLNQRFFKSTITNAGCYKLTAAAVSPSSATLLFNAPELDDLVGSDNQPVNPVITDFEAGEIVVFNISSSSPNTEFTVSLGETEASGCEVNAR
jgi:hypothetical protein